jgi:amidase
MNGPPAPKRAALCIRPEGMKVAAEVEAALRGAARRLQDAGYTVVEVDALPPLREPARLQSQLWLTNLPRGGLAAAEREGEAASLAVFDYMQRLTQPADFYGFQDALTARSGFLRQWMMFFEKYPVVICPVSGELPFADQQDVQPAAAAEQTIHACAFRLRRTQPSKAGLRPSRCAGSAAAVVAMPRAAVGGHRRTTGLATQAGGVVLADHLGHAGGDLLAHRNVQELVRAVRIRVRAKHAGDHELGTGELLAQHAHERDRATLAHVDDRLAKRSQ